MAPATPPGEMVEREAPPATLPRFDPFSPEFRGSSENAKLKVRLARLQLEAQEKEMVRKADHDLQSLPSSLRNTPSRASSTLHPYSLAQTEPGGRVTAPGRLKPGAKYSAHQQPLCVTNGSSAPSRVDFSAERPTLVIGSSILRNVKLAKPEATVTCIPGARAGDIESYLKVLAKDNRKYRKIVIHVGGNDSRLRLSEITKVNVESVCTYAKAMSDSVVFSGPLPNLTNDVMFSRMSSFHRWLSWWCPANNVGFVDNWDTFWGKPGLLRRDGIHPTLDGADLISANLTQFLCGPGP
ncbi:uncharacterized protein LOC142933416 [Anarhichas minor]|uniref:uncharacterized protein LOC142933416 n=1 Tax=Anarhichas minor TaxID=65739 RepID=UPI003F731C62